MPNFNKIRSLITLLCLLLIVALAISCAPKRQVIDPQFESNRFGFLRDGKINRQEIIDRLGEHSSSYENGRIVIYYWLGEENKAYNVVLVFNEQDVLKRHSVVRVR